MEILNLNIYTHIYKKENHMKYKDEIRNVIRVAIKDVIRIVFVAVLRAAVLTNPLKQVIIGISIIGIMTAVFWAVYRCGQINGRKRIRKNND